MATLVRENAGATQQRSAVAGQRVEGREHDAAVGVEPVCAGQGPVAAAVAAAAAAAVVVVVVVVVVDVVGGAAVVLFLLLLLMLLLFSLVFVIGCPCACR